MYRPRFLVRMKRVSLNPIAAAFLLVALTFLGCENLVAPVSDDPTPVQSRANLHPSKFRFSYLLKTNQRHSIFDANRHKNTNPYNSNRQQLLSDTNRRHYTLNNASGDSSSADLIIGFSDSTLAPSSLLQRYTSIQQYKLLRRYSGSIQFTYGMSVRVQHPDGDFNEFLEDLFDAWQSDADISWFEPDINIEQDDPEDSTSTGSSQILPWGVQDVGYSTGDVSNVHLYVIDSGVPSEDINLVETKYFTDDSLQTYQDDHGYYAASTAGAINNTTGILGVAPGVPVHSFVVTDANGLIQLSTVVQALDEIVSRKNADPTQPMVVNISLGADVQSTTYNALDEAVEAAVAAGVVVVVAAGNEGKNVATISPAHVASAITVGAFNAMDNFAWFSNYGPGVDILAPGVNVETLGRNAAGQLLVVSNSGTSLAAPHVAGAAVVHLAGNPSDSPQDVIDELLNNARSGINGVPTGTTNDAVQLDD